MGEEKEYFREEFRRLHERLDEVNNKIHKNQTDMTDKLHAHHITQLNEMNSVKIKLAAITAPISIVFGVIGAYFKALFFHK